MKNESHLIGKNVYHLGVWPPNGSQTVQRAYLLYKANEVKHKYLGHLM